jgi:hypothetical protein
MYPQKTYAGHVETEILEDGRIKYYIYMLGWDVPNELVVDPSDDNEMRGVRQMHLVMRNAADEAGDEPSYMIQGSDAEVMLDAMRSMFKKKEE